MTALDDHKIFGVQVLPLKVVPDDRGAVLHMVRIDAPHFERFGEIYFSEVNPGVIKGWKRHHLMTQRFAVPVGTIKLVIYDNRSDSPTAGLVQTVILGRPDSYQLVIVPPMVWYSFQNTGDSAAIMANCADLPFTPGESEAVPLSQSDIPYQW